MAHCYSDGYYFSVMALSFQTEEMSEPLVIEGRVSVATSGNHLASVSSSYLERIITEGFFADGEKAKDDGHSVAFKY